MGGQGSDLLSLDEELISRQAAVARKIASGDRTLPIQTTGLCERSRGRRGQWEARGGSSEETGCWADKSMDAYLRYYAQ